MPLLRRRWFPRQLTSFPPIPSFSNLPRPVTVAVLAAPVPVAAVLVALARVVLVRAARVRAAVPAALARVVLVPAARVTAAVPAALARVAMVRAARGTAAVLGALEGKEVATGRGVSVVAVVWQAACVRAHSTLGWWTAHIKK